MRMWEAPARLAVCTLTSLLTPSHCCLPFFTSLFLLFISSFSTPCIFIRCPQLCLGKTKCTWMHSIKTTSSLKQDTSASGSPRQWELSDGCSLLVWVELPLGSLSPWWAGRGLEDELHLHSKCPTTLFHGALQDPGSKVSTQSLLFSLGTFCHTSLSLCFEN